MSGDQSCSLAALVGVVFLWVTGIRFILIKRYAVIGEESVSYTHLPDRVLSHRVQVNCFILLKRCGIVEARRASMAY